MKPMTPSPNGFEECHPLLKPLRAPKNGLQGERKGRPERVIGRGAKIGRLDPLARFSKAVLALNSCGSPEDLGRALLAAVQALCDADIHVIDWIGPEKFYEAPTRSVDFASEAMMATFNRHLGDHPLLEMIVTARTGGAAQSGRWSDVTTLREFKNTALYHDFFRHVETKYQLGMAMRVTNTTVLGLALNRSTKDFSAGDLHLLRQFIPHVRQLVQTMVSRAEIEGVLGLQEVAMGASAAIVVSETGDVLFSTEDARRLWRDHFGVNLEKQMPEAMREWLMECPPDGETFLREGINGNLSFRCGPATQWPDTLEHRLIGQSNVDKTVRLLQLKEELKAMAPSDLERLGITPREAEVLFWMSQGKRNSEIGVILGVSERTVDKHCEHLFTKLGVETRTSATAMAFDITR